MAVPKRKTSKSRRDQRSANKFIRPQNVVTCTHCQAPVMPHVVCELCGYYKGRKVLATKKERSELRLQKKQAVPQEAPAVAESAEQA